MVSLTIGEIKSEIYEGTSKLADLCIHERKFMLFASVGYGAPPTFYV